MLEINQMILHIFFNYKYIRRKLQSLNFLIRINQFQSKEIPIFTMAKYKRVFVKHHKLYAFLQFKVVYNPNTNYYITFITLLVNYNYRNFIICRCYIMASMFYIIALLLYKPFRSAFIIFIIILRSYKFKCTFQFTNIREVNFKAHLPMLDLNCEYDSFCCE